MQRYVLGALGCAAAVLGSVALTNWAVDPYDFWHSAQLTGLSMHKPEISIYRRLHEARAVQLQQPEALILGTSRADSGLSPDHPVFAGTSTYNAATPGQPLVDTRTFLESTPSARRVVLGLDVFVFNCLKPNVTDPALIRLPLAERAKLLLSFTTLSSSVRTVLYRGGVPKAQWNAKGMWLMNDADIVAAGGHRAYARETEREQFFKHNYAQPFSVQCDGKKPASRPFDEFKAILELAQARKIDLRMAISPAHARIWETLDQAGLWHDWEAWKRRLVQINDQVASDYGARPFPLWDFSGYNPITTEPFPAEGDTTTAMRWYFESSHFRPVVGDLMLSQIHGKASADAPADFGVQLEQGMLDAHLQGIRDQRQAWRANHADDVAEVRASKQQAQQTGKNSAAQK